MGGPPSTLVMARSHSPPSPSCPILEDQSPVAGPDYKRIVPAQSADVNAVFSASLGAEPLVDPSDGERGAHPHRRMAPPLRTWTERRLSRRGPPRRVVDFRRNGTGRVSVALCVQSSMEGIGEDGDLQLRLRPCIPGPIFKCETVGGISLPAVVPALLSVVRERAKNGSLNRRQSSTIMVQSRARRLWSGREWLSKAQSEGRVWGGLLWPSVCLPLFCWLSRPTRTTLARCFFCPVGVLAWPQRHCPWGWRQWFGISDGGSF